MTQTPGGLNNLHHRQQLLVMPDDGAVAVVALIDAAQETLRLKQFKLQSETIEQALIRAQQRDPREVAGGGFHLRAGCHLQPQRQILH